MPDTPSAPSQPSTPWAHDPGNTTAPAWRLNASPGKKTALRLALLLVLFALVALGVAEPVLAASATLAWDPNREAELAGYCVYYRKDRAQPPYTQHGCISLQALRDPKAPRFVVTGLSQGATYCFVVTAFDKAGNESAYSNAACGRAESKSMPWLQVLLLD